MIILFSKRHSLVHLGLSAQARRVMLRDFGLFMLQTKPSLNLEFYMEVRGFIQGGLQEG